MKYRKYLTICFVFGGISLLVSLIAITIMLSSSSQSQNYGCATDERVFDLADLLSSEEEEMLREEIGKLSASSRSDLVVLTESGYRSDQEVEAFTSSFMDDMGFGWDQKNGDSVLLYLNMDIRYVYVNTYGRATDVIGHKGNIFDRVVKIVGTDNASNGYYYKGLYEGLKYIAWKMKVGKFIPGPGTYALILVCGAFISVGILIAHERKKLADKPVIADDYLKTRSILSKNHIHTGHRVIRHSSSSGGHGGGGHGGGGHGGGGGHF